MRRTDNYASNQIRILLNELSSGSHSDKKKAINNFQTYVETYQPEVMINIISKEFNEFNLVYYNCLLLCRWQMRMWIICLQGA